MDLTQFRATHPGLYQQAFEEGRAADAQRVERLFALAEAAGSIQFARRAIENGHSVEDALPQLRALASKDDERAAAFMRKLDAFGLTPKDARGSDLRIAEALISKFRGNAATSKRSAADIVADLVCGSRDTSDAGSPLYAVDADGNRRKVGSK